MPIPVPKGVQVSIERSQDGSNRSVVKVTGPRGQLSREFHPDIQIQLQGDTVTVSRPNDERQVRALHGLTRALLSNMVTGVSEGFKKQLQIEGVGYRGAMDGETLVLHLGFSHPVRVNPPQGIKFLADEKTRVITIEGNDREQVGQVAADLRKLRPPEPYKGKGIRYTDEKIRRKAGKAGKVG
jgi:large subunit ribosomal protein L6